jgi:glycosyltransferase involved in cell wall biosynthesis
MINFPMSLLEPRWELRLNRKKIFYLHNLNNAWVENDRQILSKHYELLEFFITYKSWFDLSKYIALFKSQIIYTWFCSLHFFPFVILGKLLGKKVVIAVGGFDVASQSGFNYGAYSFGGISKFLRNIMFACADEVIAVSNFNYQECLKNPKVPSRKLHMIYHAVQMPSLEIKPFIERGLEVAMVANINTQVRVSIKGFDTYLNLCKELPEVDFHHVGSLPENVKLSLGELPENLILHGEIKDSMKLMELLNNTKLALQLSKYESFCFTIVEAMIAGCHPLAFNSGALPEVVGDTSFCIDKGDVESLKLKIISALNSQFNSINIAEMTRLRFSLSKREKALLAVL